MLKLADNELVECWSCHTTETTKDVNAQLQETYLKTTGAFEIRGGTIISSRVLNDDTILSLVHRAIPGKTQGGGVYSLVMFDVSPYLPPEKPRIPKYCEFKTTLFSVIEPIIQSHVDRVSTQLRETIDARFDTMIDGFQTVKHRICGELVDVLIKPRQKNRFDLSTLGGVIKGLPQHIRDKTNLQSVTDELEKKSRDLDSREKQLKTREVMLAAGSKKVEESDTNAGSAPLLRVSHSVPSNVSIIL